MAGDTITLTAAVWTDVYGWLAGQDISFAGHGLKHDYFMLMSRGITDFETYFDTAVAQYVIDSGRSSYSLAAVVERVSPLFSEGRKGFYG